MPCWIPLVPLGMLLTLAGFTGWKILGCAGGTAGDFEILLVLGTHVKGTEPTSMLSDRCSLSQGPSPGPVRCIRVPGPQKCHLRS